MSGTGIRLTIGSVLSLVWFVLLTSALTWPAFLIFLVAVALGFSLSFIDLITVAILTAIFD